MKFNVSYLGANQDVELEWLSSKSSIVEFVHVVTLEVGESMILRHRDRADAAVCESFQVTRVS